MENAPVQASLIVDAASIAWFYITATKQVMQMGLNQNLKSATALHWNQ